VRICSLASGSSGNATYVASDRTAILVDSGPSAREIVARLNAIGADPSQLSGILITHAHVDHYKSAGTLHVRYGIPVYVDPSTARALKTRGQRTSWRRIRDLRPIPEQIGDIAVRAMDTSHGFPEHDGRTVAYLLETQRRKIGIVTDLGIPSEEMIEALRGVDAIILEANYEETVIRRKLSDRSFASDWHYLKWVLSDKGHLSNHQCGEMLAAILTKQESHVFLGHMSDNHHEPERDNNEYRRALSTIRKILEKERTPAPHLHRTYRIGLEPVGTSDLIVL
jgi:phosphoribosyl 1,2-cyclic phosphodiesterase